MNNNNKHAYQLDEISNPPDVSEMQSSAKVLYGRLIPPQQQILLYSADEWELFIQEWLHHKKTIYHKVVRFAGANDMGVDVAGFVDEIGLKGVWDNYQCKHYKDALAPKIGVEEIGKLVWHVFKRHLSCPRKYYFLAPKGCGMSLNKLLLDSEKLRKKLVEKWDDWCAKSITSKEVIYLDGDFKDFVDEFDFEIFTFITALEAIDEHHKTPYYAIRFGGGLPDRPEVTSPPETPEESESRYTEQLLEAYADHKKQNIVDLSTLDKWPDLVKHYHRQREYFYHAESLRNFARDTVPAGTFNKLQDEVYAGVVDIEASPYPCAFTRLNAVTQAAAQLPLTANGLITVTKIQDKKGICHQLANDNLLTWRKP